MDYSKIILQAWEMVRHNRFLWWLGVLAAFTESGNAAIRMFDLPSSSHNSTPKSDPETQRMVESITNWLITHETQLIITVIVVIAIVIVLKYFSYAARAGLILSADHLEKHKEKVSFKQAYNDGEKFIWKLWGFHILLSLTLFLLCMVIIGGGLIIGLVSYLISPVLGIAIGILLVLAALIVFAIMIITVGIVQEVANRLIVLKNEGVFDALTRAKNLVIAQWKRFIIAWLIDMGMGLGYGLVALIAIIFAILLVIIIGVVFGLATGILGLFAAIFSRICVLIGALVIGGMYTAFRSTYWTLVYRAIDYLHDTKES